MFVVHLDDIPNNSQVNLHLIKKSTCNLTKKKVAGVTYCLQQPPLQNLYSLYQVDQVCRSIST